MEDKPFADSLVDENKEKMSPRSKLITELKEEKKITDTYIDLIKRDEGLAGGHLEIEAIERIFNVKIYIFNAWEVWAPCEPPTNDCIRLVEDIKPSNFLPYMKEEERNLNEYSANYSINDNNSLFNSVIHCSKIILIKKSITDELKESEKPLKDLSKLDVIELRQMIGNYFEERKDLYADKFIKIAKSIKEEKERIYQNIIWKDLEREEIVLEGSAGVSVKSKLEEINSELFKTLKKTIMKKCGNSGQISFEDLRDQLLGFSRTISSKELKRMNADIDLLQENNILIEWNENPKLYLNKIEDYKDEEDDEILYKICNVDENSLSNLDPKQKSIAEKMLDKAYFDESHELTYVDVFVDLLNKKERIDYVNKFSYK